MIIGENPDTQAAYSAALGKNWGVEELTPPEHIHPARWKAMLNIIINNDFQIPDQSYKRDIERYDRCPECGMWGKDPCLVNCSLQQVKGWAWYEKHPDVS